MGSNIILEFTFSNRKKPISYDLGVTLKQLATMYGYDIESPTDYAKMCEWRNASQYNGDLFGFTISTIFIYGDGLTIVPLFAIKSLISGLAEKLASVKSVSKKVFKNTLRGLVVIVGKQGSFSKTRVLVRNGTTLECVSL